MTSDEAVAPEHAAVATELARVLHVVADATPTMGRRAVLQGALGDRPRPRRPARLLVPVAAVLLLVVAVVVVVAVVGRSHDGGTVRTGPSDTGATETPGPFDDPDLDTGWYLPGAGWDVVSVQIDYLDIGEGGVCPCLIYAAAEPGGTGVIQMSESDVPAPDDDPPSAETTPVDVGGRDGVRTDGGQGVVSAHVDVGRRRISIIIRDVPTAALVALLDAWADAREAGDEVDPADLPRPEGMVSTPIRRTEGTFEHLLAVTAVQRGTGERVEYQLVPVGFRWSYLFTSSSIAAGGGRVAFSGRSPEGDIAGAIGGPADITVGPRFFGGEGSTLDRAGLARFRDDLREVDVEEWRAALPDGGDVADEVRTAPTLFAPPLTG